MTDSSWYLPALAPFLLGAGIVIAFVALLIASFIKKPKVRWSLCCFAFISLIWQHVVWWQVDRFQHDAGGSSFGLVDWVICSYITAALWSFGLFVRQWLSIDQAAAPQDR